MTILAGARVVTPTGVIDGGWVEHEAARIRAVGSGRPSADGEDLGGAWLLPGMIDLHVHGGGGFDVASSPHDMQAAIAFHQRHGTTRTLVSLVTAPVDELCEQLSWIATSATAAERRHGHVVGAHLEGPFLASARCGAQNPEHLLAPDRSVMARLLAAGRGSVRSVTVAPELPGALDLITDVVAAGAIAAVGHTNSTYADAMAAFEAGAMLITHAGNAMAPVHQREPGVVGAALDSGVACEVINDGEHVHPAIVRLIANRADGQLVLITDAMSAAGAGDGDYRLGGQHVTVSSGTARLVSTGSLAGSTLTMDAAVRRAVLDVGLEIDVAVAAAATNPARMLGLHDKCGAIEPGLAADFVVMNDDLQVERVMVDGEWCA
jgi:N-acetylglucosamine-6-phosphate deacetylase